MVGLADCNSFYASCEKLFRPDLRDKPVVVLSNNDGCIVALSAEARKLGIQRGQPYFKCREELERLNVAVFSSNYSLYQDISDRTVCVLNDFAREVEPYSIDECFFVPPVSKGYEVYAKKLHNTLRRRTGLMISVGIARTKTLSKLANHIGKKSGGWYCIAEEEEESVLRKTDITEVWGIGWRYSNKMQHLGIRTAWDLTQKEDAWIQKNFSITGLRTASELRGQSCISEDDFKRHSFTSGISFEEPKTRFEDLEQAVACHCQVISRKLIEKGFSASSVFVHILTNRFKDDFYHAGAAVTLPHGVCYAPALLSGAKLALAKVYRPGLQYKATRVGVYDLCQISERQWSLFDSEEYKDRMRKEDALSLLVSRTPELSCLTAGLISKDNLCLSQFLSPRYTTRWADLPTVH